MTQEDSVTQSLKMQRLAPPDAGRIRVVLDTDTYNEIDDQFAVVHALLTPDRLNVEAIYAAPFHNSRSDGPRDGMEKSYDEIHRLLDRLGRSGSRFVYRGSTDYLKNRDGPEPSDAAQDLVRRGLAETDGPLYVAAVGAVTNVASALLLEPRLAERIVVVWLGGHAYHWPDTREFNLFQDVRAAQVLFDCGVPLVQIPCMGVCSHLHTTVPEIERFVEGRGAIGDYLARIFKEHHPHHRGWSKVIWDIAATAWLVDSDWVPTDIVHSPIVNENGTYAFDRSRHFIRCATHVHRDPILRDLFDKLESSMA